MIRLIIYLFYGSLLISGGLRNYSDEYVLHSNCTDFIYSETVYNFLLVFESLSFISIFIILWAPSIKWFHLISFCLFFCIDFYFQNFVYFEKYILLINFFPLVIFLLIHYQNSVKITLKVKETVIKIISIGYFTAFCGKVREGWLVFDEPMIYGVVSELNKMGVNFYLSDFFLSFKLGIYKLLDYIVLTFQFSGLFLFFNPNFFKWFSILAALFHILVLLFMSFSFFYPYLLFYALLFSDPIFINSQTKIEKLSIRLLLLIYFIGYLSNDFTIFFIFEWTGNNIQLHWDFSLTILSSLVFFLSWWNKYKLNTKNDLIC